MNNQSMKIRISVDNELAQVITVTRRESAQLAEKGECEYVACAVPEVGFVYRFSGSKKAGRDWIVKKAVSGLLQEGA